MCAALGVSRSGFYSSCSRLRPTVRESSDAELLDLIREIHTASRGTYGSPRVHAELRRRGVHVCRDRVRRLMRRDGLQGKVRRRFRKTTDSDHKRPVADNGLNRQFSPEEKDSAWCADITYIPTLSGWVYLAAIIDLTTRMIVGWSVATHMRTGLVEQALKNALATRAPAKRLVHHSDRGSQYASHSYQELLEQHGFECSMSRKGNCWDNAVMESFFGTFKQEWANHHWWSGLADARASIHDYIEVFYNRARIHSSLGYRTPFEVDRDVA